ncbi:MAG: dihydroorotase [Bacteroidetes bacterium]|nr:dihydroorotase [Bacteroidota bacterium]
MKSRKNYLIRNARIVNEGEIFEGGVLVEGDRITAVYRKDKQYTGSLPEDTLIINASGQYLIPGVIDDQVHFREPGLTHKADIYTESRAAVAGGITSFMEMPNTIPQTLTQTLLEEKYKLAASKSLANFSFYMGASNDNLDEVLKTNPENVCGVKVFMGASTGNMLVDDPATLAGIFGKSPLLVAVHCEDETIIKENLASYKEEYGDNIPIEFHPEIRSEEACYESSSFAVRLAKKYGTRLHVLHLSTARELGLFDNQIPLKDKKITCEVCVHHLWFSSDDYQELGALIKWNPAVKTEHDREALLEALKMDIIDVVATDHAPHTLDEKSKPYTQAPSGGPLVQHALPAMLDFYQKGRIPLWKVVEKMCHAPADCFKIKDRGFIREGYFADLVLIDLNNPWIVDDSNILYKCAWSPFNGNTFGAKVTKTFVNGNLVYDDGLFDESNFGQRLIFER